MVTLTPTLSLRPMTAFEASTPEVLPFELREWHFPFPDPEWSWIVERGGEPIGLILTTRVMGVLFFWRILGRSGRSRNWLLAALPKVLENARVRGCVAYATFLHDTAPEAQFGRIIQRLGGSLEPWVGSLAVAPLRE